MYFIGETGMQLLKCLKSATIKDRGETYGKECKQIVLKTLLKAYMYVLTNQKAMKNSFAQAHIWRSFSFRLDKDGSLAGPYRELGSIGVRLLMLLSMLFSGVGSDTWEEERAAVRILNVVVC